MRQPRKVAVMQPYFLPYIGYFQLVAAVDVFVVYDNIKYTKKGWINRNRLLAGGVDQTFTLPLRAGSDAEHVRERFLADDFRPRVIADITCDIQGSVPTTLRSSTIESPIYGYDRFTATEADPYSENSITIMAVDNLPCEIPADASSGFGAELMEKVLPLFLEDDVQKVLERATIAQDGKLSRYFGYLEDYVAD